MEEQKTPIDPGSPPQTPPTAPPGEPGGPPTPPTGPTPEPAPPPAAKIVLEGTKTERELTLERQLKDRETRISELEDENRGLKTPPAPPQARPGQKEKKSWLSGATFFSED